MSSFKKKEYQLKLLIVFLLAIFYFFLVELYPNTLVPIYSYEGFKYTPSPERIVFSRSFALFVLTILGLGKTSSFTFSILSLFTLLCVFPNLILHENMDTNPLIVVSVSFHFFIIWLLSLFPIRLKTIQFPKKNRLYFLLLVAVLSIIPFIFTFGLSFNLNNLLLEDIYVTRLDSRSKFNAFTGYALNNLANVLIPILMILGLKSKKYIVVFIAIALMIYLFLCNAAKFLLFSIVLNIIFYFGSYIKKTLGLIIFFFILCIYAYNTDSIPVISLSLNRSMFAPALVNHYYFDFFAERPLFYSHSILKWLITYPYEVLPPNLIGWYYFDNIEMSANNGISSDGFMNLGFLGVIIHGTMIGFVFAYLNALRIADNYFGIFFTLMSALISAEFFTTLFSHGMLLLIIISTFFLKNSVLKEKL